MGWYNVFKGLLLIAALALVGAVLEASDFGSVVNVRWVDAEVRGHGLGGILLFLFVGGLFTGIGLPRQLIAFLGGYGFGLAGGVIAAELATVTGCMLSFGFSRFFGSGLLRDRMGERAARFDRFVRTHPFWMTVLIRLLPVGNNLVTNLAAGISSIPLRYFLMGSLIGYLPQTAVFALVGSGVHVPGWQRLALAAGLFVASGVLGTWLYHRLRHGNGLDDPTDSSFQELHSVSRASDTRT